MKLQEISLEYQNGLHLTDSVLWFDAPRNADLCFLSNAKIAVRKPLGKILLTKATATLSPNRIAKAKKLISPYHQPFTMGDLDLELYPSGYMLGAAQLRVGFQKKTIVYTGDFQLAPSYTAGQAPILACDVLIIKSGAESEKQKAPSRSESLAALTDWVRGVLKSGQQPVVFVSPLGEAQEVIAALLKDSLAVRAHRSIYKFSKKYQTLGVGLDGLRCLWRLVQKQDVIVFPIQLRRSISLTKLGPIKSALLTDRPEGEPLETTQSFYFSMRADHQAIIDYAKKSAAQKIYLVGDKLKDLESRLTKICRQVSCLTPPEQMALFQRLI
jgi:hypothetical protein